ncbi:MAG: cobyrinate a,c-diamide synthase [Burkholderia sp.]|nr:cobyrinate a,c-diamide synthase [Burkholderia sp.]
MPACPALLIASPASRHGKTLVTAGLARMYRRIGFNIRVFKTGPDFLDPILLEYASGSSVYSLDLGMVGKNECHTLLAQAAKDVDLILIEGVMGLFDGMPSTADLSIAFRIPIVAVISAKSIAQTFAAIAFGLAYFNQDLLFYGVLANQVSSVRHRQLLQERLPNELRWLGYVNADTSVALPERYLGLYQPKDISDLDMRLERIADMLALTELDVLPPPVSFVDPRPVEILSIDKIITRRHIAIARDAAFSFIYPANLALLKNMLKAQLHFFSPLANDPLPDGCDTLFIPGGYPELHAQALSSNKRSADTIREHIRAEKPIIAECGGMIYLCDAVVDSNDRITSMLGMLPGIAKIQDRLIALGMQQFDTRYGPLRGHTFHYSRFYTKLIPAATAYQLDNADHSGEAIYQYGSIVATYMHMYWPSNPVAASSLLNGEKI